MSREIRNQLEAESIGNTARDLLRHPDDLYSYGHYVESIVGVVLLKLDSFSESETTTSARNLVPTTLRLESLTDTVFNLDSVYDLSTDEGLQDADVDVLEAAQRAANPMSPSGVLLKAVYQRATAKSMSRENDHKNQRLIRMSAQSLAAKGYRETRSVRDITLENGDELFICCVKYAGAVSMNPVKPGSAEDPLLQVVLREKGDKHQLVMQNINGGNYEMFSEIADDIDRMAPVVNPAQLVYENGVLMDVIVYPEQLRVLREAMQAAGLCQPSEKELFKMEAAIYQASLTS